MRQNKRRRDIKSKLIAAICMLLVSSIMMVSTTYAWFTLSTAPEVTGINTSVGANGNLEMALLPTSGDTDDISSEAGDSLKAVVERNVTWGNLVDLSDSTVYGLDQLVLFPSALNDATTDTAGNVASLATTLLETPTYGPDGRVSELVANTVTSTYNTADQNFPQNGNYGVRAVGTASGMTDRQLAYRNSRSAANTAMAQAKTAASQSLNTNGSALANIALAHGVDATATHTKADVEALKRIVIDLVGNGTDNPGVLGYIEDAYLNYIIAYGASKASPMTDEQFKAFQSAVNSAASLTDAMNTLTAYGVEIPEAASTPIAKLADTRETVEDALSELNDITAETGIEWGTISAPLYKLADTNAMKVNGFEISSVKDNMSPLINSVTAQGGLTVTIATGGGVYADVADHCGNFDASITIAEVTYGGVTLENMNARMATATTVNPVYLAVLGTAVETAEAPESAGGQVMPISDMYGYVIDLAFKTNAAESDLLLQTEATDRIYSDNGEGSESMGHGSSMTFKATPIDFSNEQVKALMSAIRIVFFVPGSGSENNTVLATAKLDTANAVITADGIKANMYLYENQVVGVVDESGNPVYKTDGNGNNLDANGAVTTDPTQFVQETEIKEGVMLTEKEDAVLTALTQNVAHKVSVLVYLDGNLVKNDDVAATAATSMTGQMNLQFASSAQLKPMNYTPLQTQGTAQTPATPEGEGGEG